jgi:hypothetical protein
MSHEPDLAQPATRLVIMSDTHLPSRAKDLPPQLWADAEQATS